MEPKDALMLIKEQYNAMWEALANMNALGFLPEVVETDANEMGQAWSAIEELV